MAMSSASSCLAALLAVLLILLATMAGTEGDASEPPLPSSNSSSTSTAPTTIVAEVVVTDQIASQRNRTNEIVLVSTSPDSRYVRTTTTTTTSRASKGDRSMSADNFEESSTARSLINSTDFIATTPSSSDKPTSTSARAENITDETIIHRQPQQEQLIGLIENATDNLTTRPALESTSSGVFRELTSRFEATTRTLELSITSARISTARPTTSADTDKSPNSKSRNDLLGGNFHEIKSAQKVNTKLLGYYGGKIVKPNVPSALGKYTPYFEDGQEELNVTARIGSTVVLDCEIGMLGNKTVTWSHHSAEVIRLLTFGRNAYSVDQRISLSFKYPTNWRLKIQYATPRDSGLYECQVATYPPLVKKIHLLVTAPILTIMDDSGRIKSGERHLKAGSALRLRCEALDVPEQYNETVIWTRGDEILSEDVSENRTTDILEGRDVQVIISTFVIEKATPRHAGNYSCVVPEKARATVAVHVLNGELPAAVHDGNGVSRSVFNLWLIHLTVSYVFSR